MKFVIAYLIACVAVFGFWLALVAVCQHRERRREAAYRRLLHEARALKLAAELHVGDEVAAMRGRVSARVQSGSWPAEAEGRIPSPETEVAHLRSAGVL